MTTDRRAYKIDRNNPGSDLAGETAAAMAAASIVFRRSDPSYSAELLRHAHEVNLSTLSTNGKDWNLTRHQYLKPGLVN